MTSSKWQKPTSNSGSPIWGGGRCSIRGRTGSLPEASTFHLCPFLPVTLMAEMPCHCLSVQLFLSRNKLCRGRRFLALVLNWFSGDSLLAQHGPLLTSRPVNSDYKMLTWCLVTVAMVIGSSRGRFPQMVLTSYWMVLPPTTPQSLRS